MLLVVDNKAFGDLRFAIFQTFRPTRALSFPTHFFPQMQRKAKRELTEQLVLVIL